MNGWLMLWLALTLLGPLGLSLAVWWERETDIILDSLAAFLIVAGLLFASMVGAIGTMGWLIVWMFG